MSPKRRADTEIDEDDFQVSQKPAKKNIPNLKID
jgi:hypothetical protein